MPHDDDSNADDRWTPDVLMSSNNTNSQFDLSNADMMSILSSSVVIVAQTYFHCSNDFVLCSLRCACVMQRAQIFIGLLLLLDWETLARHQLEIQLDQNSFVFIMPSKRRRGGYRQQLADTDSDADEPCLANRLALELLEDFYLDKLSSVNLQRYALSAVEDGLSHPHLVALSKLGSNGQYPNKIWGGIHERFVPTHIESAFASEPILHTVDEEGNEGIANLEIVYPHEVFSIMYDKYEAQFTSRMLGGDAANVSSFWDSMRDHPAYESHPMRGRSEFKDKCIPLGFHGDGVSMLGVGRS